MNNIFIIIHVSSFFCVTFLLSLTDVYHIAMVDTDYETYAAYVECNGDFTRNFPVISSTSLNLEQEKVYFWFK